jgi:mRNA interferase MazF
LQNVDGEKYFIVVSNNARNRALDSALAVRLTSSRKPSLPSIVSVPGHEVVPGGFIVCDDIYEVFDDEIVADIGALSPATMRAVEAGLKAALGLT